MIIDRLKQVKILIIEDNEDIQEAANLIFELHWPEALIIQAFNGSDGADKVKKYSPDVVLLDLGLPDIDGLRVLKEIREHSDIPVVILTVRGEEMDKVRGLEMGADDYIVKPFGHRELLARVRSVLNKHRPAITTTRENKCSSEQTITKPPGKLRIDFATGTVLKDNKPVNLTNIEYKILKYLASRSGKSVSEQELLSSIWGDAYIDCGEYLEAYIKRLRIKLEENPEVPVIILQDSNGYRISPELIATE